MSDPLDEVRKVIPTPVTDVEIREAEVLTIPATGAVVNLNEPREVGVALQDIQALEGRFRDVKRILKDALVSYWQTGGTAKTFPIGGGRTAIISGGPDKQFDAVAIRDDLRAAGMPEERVSEIVVEEITYTVKAVEAVKAAKANPEYRAIIERHTTPIERPYDVRIRRQ